MSVNKTDISQIQKYLKGELDAKAMHALEREAQEDPFLMEAMEGYQTVNRDQQANLDEVKLRLDQRVQPHNNMRRIILWRILPVAATLLVVLGIGLIWFAPADTAEKSAKHYTNNTTASVNKVEKPRETLAPAAAASAEVSEAADVKSPEAESRTADPSGKKKHESYATQSPAATEPEQLAVAKTVSAAKANPPATAKSISGVITDATGHALAGVKVAVKGTALQVVTDANGGFNISAPTSQDTLSIAYAGYDTRRVNVNGKDSVKVVLQESATELATVSVPGYVDKDVSAEGESRPALGWKAFRDYIRKNAFMPGGETGRVKLAFTVAANGSITGIRVIRGKSDAMNQKAIELVLNGPEWKGMNDPKEMKLRIRFRKMKNT